MSLSDSDYAPRPTTITYGTGYIQDQEHLLTKDAIANAIDQQVRKLTQSILKSVNDTSSRIASSHECEKIRFEAKLLVGQRSMHFPVGWRSSIFQHLDRLLASDEWEPGETLPTIPSLNTLLRMILYIRPDVSPNLAVSPRGNFAAIWSVEQSRLTVECFALDEIEWSLSCFENMRSRVAAGRENFITLPKSLSGYSPNQWFNNGHL